MTENRPGEVQPGVMSTRGETLVSTIARIAELRESYQTLQSQEIELIEQFEKVSQENEKQIDVLGEKQSAIRMAIQEEKRKALIDGGLLSRVPWSFVEIDHNGWVVLECTDTRTLPEELYDLTPSNECDFPLDDSRNAVIRTKRLRHVKRIERLRLRFHIADDSGILLAWAGRLGLQIDGEGLDRATKEAYRRGDLLSALLRKHGCIVSDVVAPTE